MLEAFQYIATFAATLFAGAALYINVVEHPARMTLETRSAALQWAPSYKRATMLQAPLALISFACGMGSWHLGGQSAWLVSALLTGSVVPFTLIVILPINRRLLDSTRDLASAETRALLTRWNRLHAARTALSLAAVAINLRLLQAA